MNMTFDYEAYAEIEEKINKFLLINPQNPNLMSEDKLNEYWELRNEQLSMITILKDK